MTNAADRKALGDANVMINIESNDETGALANAFRRMIDNIQYQVMIVSKFAKGDLTVEVEPKSDYETKETTDMIANSIKKSEDGTKIAQETSDALNKIIESIEHSSSLVNEITNASNDQAMSIGQINLGIEQVLSVVQANSATSEENAAASEELASQSDVLKNLISSYRLV